MLNERNQSVNTTYCMVPITWHCGKGKTTKWRKKKSQWILEFQKEGYTVELSVFWGHTILCGITTVGIWQAFVKTKIYRSVQI